MQKKRFVMMMAVAVVFLVCASAGPARAEGLLTGFVGSTFGGDASDSAATYGLAIGATVGGIFGVEFDLGTSSNIFGVDELTTDGSVTTAMGNVLVGIGGPVRPYVSGGAGLIHSSIEGPAASSVDQNDAGVNVGVGVIGFLSDHVGIRGDIRYFRSVGGDNDGDPLDFDLRLGSLEFWRGSAGVTVRW